MKKTIAAISLTASFLAFPLSAKVSFTLDIEALTDSDAATPIFDSGLLVLVVDAGGDGFSMPTDGNLVSGNDEVVATWDLATLDFTTPDVTLPPASVTYDAGWSEGDPLALFWYPDLTSASSTPSADTAFGVFADSFGLASGDTWSMPSDGTLLHSLKFFTAAATKLVMFGDFPDGAGVTAFAVNNPPAASPLPDLEVASSGGKSTLTWTVSASPTGGYVIQRKANNGSWETIGFADPSDTSYVDNDVKAGVNYQYQVFSQSGTMFAQSDVPPAVQAERSKFINLAARGHIVPGSSNRDWTLLNAGIVLAGSDPEKRMLGLGIGPYNRARLNQPWLEDTTMLLEIAGVTVAENDNWMRDEIDPNAPNPDAQTIDTAIATIGAPQIPADDPDSNFIGRDSGIIENIALGPNIFKVFSKSDTAEAGFVGVQVYDAEFEGGDNPTIHDNRIVNLSTKGYLAENGVFNGSLVVQGSVPKEVLVLARGPALTIKGVAAALADPKLIMKRGNDVLLENDNWDSQVATTNPARGLLSVETDINRIRAAISSIGQDPDEHTLDSAMLVTVEPGAEGYIFKVEATSTSANQEGTVQIQINEIEMD